MLVCLFVVVVAAAAFVAVVVMVCFCCFAVYYSHSKLKFFCRGPNRFYMPKQQEPQQQQEQITTIATLNVLNNDAGSEHDVMIN